MKDIKERLQEVRTSLGGKAELVAVSKFHSASRIRECYEAGQRIFGESRVQELRAKKDQLPADIQWHFIGHLQQNKVKYIAPYVALIHAVDSLSLLQEINKQAQKQNRVIPCLLEIRVAQEESKFGFTPAACRDMLAEGSWRALQHVRIDGLMCMASNTTDEERIRSEFRLAQALFDELKTGCFSSAPNFCIRSWGMSGDYPIALQEGCNMVRIGTAIFGPRDY